MLTWFGKKPLSEVTAFPAQHMETFDPTGSLGKARSSSGWEGWPARYPRGGLLFHGDNKEVLAHLLANGFRGKVNLVYIDPPFDSGADYVRKVSLRGPKGAVRVEGEGYTLGEQVQYTDIWANDNYLQFMYERLMLLRELLQPDGYIVVHADARRAHHVRMCLDEVFGEDCFRNQIAWKRTSAHAAPRSYGSVTDFLLFYGRDPTAGHWRSLYQEMTQEHIERHYRHRDERGLFALGELTAPGVRAGPSGEPWRGFDPRAMGRHWAAVPTELDAMDTRGLINWPETKGAWPRAKRYLEDTKGRPCSDFWDDIDPINMVGRERVDYPTQKPEAILERILESGTRPDDLVLDCFIGSGTTAAVAQRLGRRWVGCDINKGAIQTTAKRLQGILGDQIAAAQKARAASSQTSFLEPLHADDATASRPPTQLGFTVWRVNDYDLQIQHNEAVNLAVEHLGIERNRADGFFDGTRGRALVKVVPFQHPCSPLDLDEIKRELEARKNEDRDVTVVCLGQELAARAWLEDWNRLRKKGSGNRIAVIELRSDPIYGKFFEHQPATADVSVKRKGAKIVVEIQDFLSPTIVERLRQQTGIVQPKIDDWRAMVDSVAIDPDYDGKVFNVAALDIPARKTDLVVGRYEIAAPAGERAVAVRITDMLGEEVLVVYRIG